MSHLLRKCTEISHGRLTLSSADLDKDIFSELELDSLDFAELLYSAADSLGLQVDENVDWGDFRTLGDIARHLGGATGAD